MSHQIKKLMPMGQWATNKGIAECVELEGFGIVGAVIDAEGNSIVLHRALVCHELLLALDDLLAAVDEADARQRAGLAVSPAVWSNFYGAGVAARAIIAKTTGVSP